MTTQAIDNGETSVIVDGNAPDNRSQMLASASRIASTVIATEGTLAETAKAWGMNIFNAVYADNGNLDALIGDSKVAAGWNSLSSSEAGKRAKGRLEVYFSNARLVAERWSGMTDEQRGDVLKGLSSIHYLAGQFRSADKAAKKAADKEAARVKAEEAAAAAKVEAADTSHETGTPEQPSLSDAVMALAARYEAATAEEKHAAHEAFAFLVELINADIVDSGEATPEEVEAVAAAA